MFKTEEERELAKNAIKKKDLIHNGIYTGHCRNTDKAIWNINTQKFTYLRTKFGTTFDDTINHFEDDNGYDIFFPLEYIQTYDRFITLKYREIVERYIDNKIEAIKIFKDLNYNQQLQLLKFETIYKCDLNYEHHIIFQILENITPNTIW
jgi:hypothetical protein